MLLQSQNRARGFRQEHDSLGEKDIPIDAYWGIHTSRALDNFQLSEMRLSQFPAHMVQSSLPQRARTSGLVF